MAELQALQQALRGAEDQQALIEALAQLGARQRAVQGGARDGEALDPLAVEQRSIQRDTERLLREQGDLANAVAQALADAQQAQQDASQAAGQGRRQQAAAAAAAAAAALAEAERQARGEQQAQQQSAPSEEQQDALALLRQLAADQEQVTLKARRLDRQLRDQQQTEDGRSPAWPQLVAICRPLVMPSRKWPYDSIKKSCPYWIARLLQVGRLSGCS